LHGQIVLLKSVEECVKQENLSWLLHLIGVYKTKITKFQERVFEGHNH